MFTLPLCLTPDLVAHVPKIKHRPCTAEDCDDDVGHYCQQALTGPRAGVWGIGVAGRCLSKTLAQGQYMAQGCKNLVIAAAPKVCWHSSCVISLYYMLVHIVCTASLQLLLLCSAFLITYMCQKGDNCNCILVRILQEAQKLFMSDMSKTAVADKFIALQNAAGITTPLVNPRGSGINAVTLTGWGALAALTSFTTVTIGLLATSYIGVMWFRTHLML